MSLENLALFETHELPIRHVGEVHNGKVRSVYWLTPEDNKRLIEQRGYNVHPSAQLGVMVISDRISAFDVIWQGEEGLRGVPKKGASLNIVSKHWFDRFDEEGLAGNHVLDIPHPLVWIVQKAQPILVEGVARQYITGSMWRDYAEGKREFCGNTLPSGLKKDQKLSELLITPTTKGILKGIPGVPEKDDANITRSQISENYFKFGFWVSSHVNKYEKLLRQGFDLIARDLDDIGKLFIDIKFEFGYVRNNDGSVRMIYIDEVGTPDSSRIYHKKSYEEGKIVESSKEPFRKFLLANTDRDVLLNKNRMPERIELAASYRVPVEQMMEVSRVYSEIAREITGVTVPDIENPRAEILGALIPYGIVE